LFFFIHIALTIKRIQVLNVLQTAIKTAINEWSIGIQEDQLGTAINETSAAPMKTLKETQKKLVQSEKGHQLGQLSAGDLPHELIYYRLLLKYMGSLSDYTLATSYIPPSGPLGQSQNSLKALKRFGSMFQWFNKLCGWLDIGFLMVDSQNCNQESKQGVKKNSMYFRRS